MLFQTQLPHSTAHTHPRTAKMSAVVGAAPIVPDAKAAAAPPADAKGGKAKGKGKAMKGMKGKKLNAMLAMKARKKAMKAAGAAGDAADPTASPKAKAMKAMKATVAMKVAKGRGHVLSLIGAWASGKRLQDAMDEAGVDKDGQQAIVVVPKKTRGGAVLKKPAAAPRPGTRDRNKNYHFEKIKKADKVPKFVLAMCDEARINDFIIFSFLFDWLTFLGPQD